MAVCHSVRTLEHLLYSEDVSKFKTVYEDGKTLLHFAILRAVEPMKVYIRRSCPKITHIDIVEGKRLETVMLLTKVLMLDINKQDKHRKTALHYAAVQVLPKVVKYLVDAGADWSVKDEGDTALENALRNKRSDKYFRKFLPCQWTSDHVFKVCQSTVFDELASYLLRLEAITLYDVRANNLLSGMVYHRLPLSLYSLFKSALDVNCAGKHLLAYLNQTIFNDFWNKRDDVLRVFIFFNISLLEFSCGVPFRESVLHRMFYYLRYSFFHIGDFLKPPDSEGAEMNVTTRKDICQSIEQYKAETLAVSWFIEIGVDITRKTKSGLTVLVLATR